MNSIQKPLRLNKLEIKNRLFKPALSEQLGDRDGNPKVELLSRLYSTWAQGGAGLLVSGNIMVDRTSLGEPSNIILDEQSDLGLFKAWVKSARQNNTAFFAQINHPGKQIPKFLSKHPMAPSAVPLEGPMAKNFGQPVAMTEDDIERVISQFVTAARLSKEVGFDGIQIHGAHGYLISQFLSPRHNQRDDKWQDGQLFLVTIYRRIRAVLGSDFPIIIKLNSSDFEKDGYSESDAIAIMKRLEQEGIDGIEVSGGTYESQSMVGEGQQAGGYFLKFAQGARNELSIPLLVTGGFLSKEHIENALGDRIDMVGMARSMVLNPNLANEILKGDGREYSNRIHLGRWEKLGKLFMLSWWESQMLRIAIGKQPKPNMHIFRAVMHGLKHTGLSVLLPRRT